MAGKYLTPEEVAQLGLEEENEYLSPEEVADLGLEREPQPHAPERQSALEVGLQQAAPFAAEIGAIGAGVAEAPKKMMEGGPRAAFENYKGWRDKLYQHMDEGRAQHPEAAQTGDAAGMLMGAAGLARSAIGKGLTAGIARGMGKEAPAVIDDAAHAGMDTFRKAFGESSAPMAKPGLLKDTLQTTARTIAHSPHIRAGIEKGAQVFRKMPPELVELTPFGGKVQAGVRVAQKALNAAKAYGGPTKNLGVAGAAVGAGGALSPEEGENVAQEGAQEPTEHVWTRENAEANGHRFEQTPVAQKLAQRALRALDDHAHSGRIGGQQLIHARGAVNWLAANMNNPYYMKQALDKVATEPAQALNIVQGIMAGMMQQPDDEEQQP